MCLHCASLGRRTFGLPKTSGATKPEQKETPPVGKKSTEEVAASSPTWDTLEAFARQSMQELGIVGFFAASRAMQRS